MSAKYRRTEVSVASEVVLGLEILETTPRFRSASGAKHNATDGKIVYLAGVVNISILSVIASAWPRSCEGGN
jgi:hypothetical protein